MAAYEDKTTIGIEEGKGGLTRDVQTSVDSSRNCIMRVTCIRMRTQKIGAGIWIYFPSFPAEQIIVNSSLWLLPKKKQINKIKRKNKKRSGECLTRTTFLGPRIPFGARQIDPFAS